MKEYKISFCTTSMNRVSHIEQTLVKNILDNEDYQNLEFTILDYNSNDGLEEYIRSNLGKYLDSGILSYYRTEEPDRYNMAHSRNVAFKLATGDILCNIDADNFTGKGFASYVNNVFNKQPKIFLTSQSLKSHVKNDVLGRICVKRQDFLNVRGYDERMVCYGFDDFDFINRLELQGLKRFTIEAPIFLEAISHNNSKRLANMINMEDVSSIYINYVSPAESVLLYLFKDQRYSRATMINNHLYSALISPPIKKIGLEHLYGIKEDKWETGTWVKEKTHLKFTCEKLEYSFAYNDEVMHNHEGGIYNLLHDNGLNEAALLFFHQISNRLIMEENSISTELNINKSGFGEVLIKRSNVIQTF